MAYANWGLKEKKVIRKEKMHQFTQCPLRNTSQNKMVLNMPLRAMIELVNHFNTITPPILFPHITSEMHTWNKRESRKPMDTISNHNSKTPIKTIKQRQKQKIIKRMPNELSSHTLLYLGAFKLI